MSEVSGDANGTGITSEAAKFLRKDVFDNMGRLLLARGMAITPEMNGLLTKYDIKLDATYIVNSTAAAGSQRKKRQVMDVNAMTALLEGATAVKGKAVRHAEKMVNLVFDHLRDKYSLLGLQLSILARSLTPTYSHSVNVAFLAALIATEYGHTGRELRELILGSLLHDVGRLTVPSAINSKSGLTATEVEIVKGHTRGGEIILTNLGLSPDIAAIASQHHESYNGTGYPYALNADQININAHIVRVADVFDALLSLEMYQNPLGMKETVTIIKKRRALDFHPEVADAFTGIIA